MKFIVPIIVLGIIMLQFYFYVKNLKRMHASVPRHLYEKGYLGHIT